MERQRERFREKRKCYTAEFEGEGRDYEWSDAGGLQGLDKTGEWLLPLKPSEGTGPGSHLDWSLVELVSDF